MSEMSTNRGDPAAADATFVGRGFGWPLGVDHTGSMRLSEGVADLDRSLEIVLMTAPGERLMRPQFGCRIWELMFEPVTANLLGQIAEAVRDALAQWEPRIEVIDVRPVPDATNASLIHVEIDYRVRATNDRRNLVHPFYVIPHDSEPGA
ncbi:GPW/gp25 family protein [Nocardioides sp.]|uniref:GPW/gp25 family protein n=1 Tax=Nocardioides sp. TaxID=35761 RepID=UPI003568173A